MASVIWILYVVLYAEFMCAVSADKLVSLNCQDENHGVHGKDSLLKCFLNSGGESVMVTAATWRRPGGKRPLLMFINDKVKMPEDPRFSFKQLQVSGRNIDVSFLVRNTMRTDEGKYECEVVTDSGEAKAVVSLSVTATYSKPDMSSVPEKDLQEDMEVTLFCNASGGYPVGMIHWYDQHGTNWTRSAEMTVVETTDKRTNLSSKFTLRASSITPQYRCLVLNNNGVEEGKAEFDLKFRENELVSLDCQDENHGVLGKDSLLKCFLKSGGESVKVTAATWRRPGEKPPIIMFINEKVRMPEDPRFSFKQSQLSGSNIDVSFLVRNTLWTDEGKYECIVEADSGEAKAVVSLSVTATYSKPDMSSVPEKDLQEGMEVTLFCNASGGYPVGMIHWYDQHGTNWTPSAEMTVVETTDKRTNLSSKFTLRASSITPRYRCLVLNNNGVEEGKAEFALKFREKELLSLDCQDENHGVHGKDSLLKCFLNSGGINVTVTAATWRRPGEKPPLIMFINDKVREPEDPRFSFKQLQMSGSNIDVSFLVRDTVRTDEGKYECEVVTDSGEAKAVVSLSVTATYSKPDMSSVPEKDLQEGMEVTLFCNASGGYPVAMIRWYDQHGTDWTPSAEMTVVETTDKHTNLSSKVTLKASSSAPLYRCLVLNNNGVEEGKAEFDLKFRENEFLSLDCQDENHGVYGKESLLKCFLNSGGKNVTVTAASWWRSGEKPPLIMFINDKVREPEDPRFSFKQLQMSGSNIDVSFLVRNTLWTDEGEYECEVVTDSGEAKAVVSLSVTATYSKPDMSSVPEKDLQEGMEVTLFCSASGGYPVGMIHWYDQHGTNWTRSAEMTVVETTDKHTNLSSKFTLKASSSAPLYRCLVLNNNGVEEGKAEFDLKFRENASGGDCASSSACPSGRWSCRQEPLCPMGRGREAECRLHWHWLWRRHWYWSDRSWDQGIWCRRRGEWDEGLIPWKLRWQGVGVVIPYPPRQPWRNGQRELVSLDCQDENHGVLGEDSLLKCFLNSGGKNMTFMSASWWRPGGKPPLIMFIMDEVLEPEDPRFSFKQSQMSGSNIDVSFLVRNTLRTDEGKYECFVVTDSGYAKAVVSLSVTATYSKPDMSSVPEKDLQEGMEVTLFCNASGGYPVGMIHWYDQYGTDCTPSAEMTVVETTDKRTNLSSKFTLKASSSAPLYRCSVLNNNGVEGEAEFDLKFRKKELVSLNCQDENHGVHGKDSLLKCFLNSGGESVRVTAATWRRPGEKRPLIKFRYNKVSVREDPRFSFKQLQWSGSNIDVSFLVRNTVRTDEGKYECKVVTDSGDAKAVVSLSVRATYSKPDMSSVPEKDLQEGMEVTLFCNASGGYPVGMIHWYDQHGTDWTRSAEMTVVETTDKHTNLSSKVTLRASSITPQYRCLVFNNNGVEGGKAEFALKFREKEGDQGSMGSMSSTASTASTAVLVIVIPLLCGLLILALRRQRAQPARRLSTHPILGAMYPEGSDMMEEGFLKKGVQAMQWITISSCSTSSAGLNNGRSMELIPPFF
ncbi:uncharacterized protein LOC118221546 isoform X6 [Anguilla anguilla]|uniref:uncharacterized protein LOC118221546 isoform X6 n=1 Tax=Anguilla anguilla TaxID=7936 RepID=UPI0015A764E9|nr:uncharacterized protein LOC118221546 isoform X6 [Anguilla anguilla]